MINIFKKKKIGKRINLTEEDVEILRTSIIKNVLERGNKIYSKKKNYVMGDFDNIEHCLNLINGISNKDLGKRLISSFKEDGYTEEEIRGRWNLKK